MCRAWIDLVLQSAMRFVGSMMTVNGVLLFSSLIVSSSLSKHVLPFPLWLFPCLHQSNTVSRGVDFVR